MKTETLTSRPQPELGVDLERNQLAARIARLPEAERARLLSEFTTPLGTARLPGIATNPALATDSYKASHYLQYPPGTDGLFAYVESRGGAFGQLLFFGLQMILKEYLSRRLTLDDVDEAERLWQAHGLPFNRAGFEYIVRECDGAFPLRIRALPEGSAVPPGVPMITVESTDARAFWCVSFIETLLLQVWYPTTVASLAWHARATIRRYLEATSDDVAASLPFKLHDFGYRGATSPESAARAGVAHLVSFLGTDTVAALEAATRYYRQQTPAGFSIPAAEHSTMTSWGRDGELAAYRNMLDRFARPGAVLAVVSDSYDIYTAVDALWGGALREQVVASGATVVVRPDSGDPVEVVLEVARRLEAAYGSRLTSKGYKLLQHVRIIQGDGVNLDTIERVLAALQAAGFAADNVAFGMGGALHQAVNRDTCKFAMKCSAVRVGGEWRDIFKAPVTDPGKRSKSGRLGVLRSRDGGAFRTVVLPNDGATGWHDRGTEAGNDWEDALRTVWDNGRLEVDDSLGVIRARAAGVSPRT
ncbi:MAG: nicotinate phosphoribosyltransferase [Rhodocyclaceae bacterium]